MSSPIEISKEIAPLRQLSARWGRDISMTQGAGGNTSLKVGDLLHVKASGARLAEAEERDIFVTVPLDAARAMVNGAPAPTVEGNLRPSIETSLHAITPFTVVAHLHMIDAIAVSVQEDAVTALSERLPDLPWLWVPYMKPGPDLAGFLRTLFVTRSEAIAILANHGVLVGGDNCTELAARVELLRERLKGPDRRNPPDMPKLRMLADRLGLEPARFEEAHWAATDRDNITFATAGSLYPDHVVFLGRGAVLLDEDALAVPDGPSSLFLVPGVGTLLRPGLSLAAHEMAACLGLVVSRIAVGASVRPLTRADEDALIYWDAEIYRQGLAT